MTIWRNLFLLVFLCGLNLGFMILHIDSRLALLNAAAAGATFVLAVNLWLTT